MRSALAISSQVFGFPEFVNRRLRKHRLFGVTVHTTGSALPKRVANTVDATLGEAARLYTKTGGPHYVIGWDGTIVSVIRDERIRGAHAGIADEFARRAYNDNSWPGFVSVPGVSLWRKQWPGRRSPKDLIPTGRLSDINDLWLGIELIPIVGGQQPAFGGARFTMEQHQALRQLVQDIARRHGFPRGWDDTGNPRLLGHSDLNPITRDHPRVPLWDPGYHIGLLDLDFVRSGAEDDAEDGLGVLDVLALALGVTGFTALGVALTQKARKEREW